MRERKRKRKQSKAEKKVSVSDGTRAVGQMFKVRKRRARPQASFDLCSSVDTDARETPLKRARASPAPLPALPARPDNDSDASEAASPLTAAAAAQQRSRESSLSRQSSESSSNSAPAAPAPTRPEAVVNSVAVCDGFLFFIIFLSFSFLFCAWLNETCFEHE